ncbi:hypothetical protein EYF80_014455 [Liparis tanakae]|uniref:Uncharacterized protein n=1 Tax=Liparis tanakae TaxID=230148 RepID=A0A4Z2IBM4_9TELE|nr:hypothetical protein EYF80_014455 [Liparis tanakae]
MDKRGTGYRNAISKVNPPSPSEGLCSSQHGACVCQAERGLRGHVPESSANMRRGQPPPIAHSRFQTRAKLDEPLETRRRSGTGRREITKTIGGFTMTDWHVHWEIPSAICHDWWAGDKKIGSLSRPN